MSSKFHGIYPMLYAYFGPDGRLDRQAMKRQIDACIAAGVHGIAILGVVTEFNKLDVNERRQLIEWTAEDVGGRVPLAVTVGEMSVHGQIEIARLAAEVKADWIILQPPSVKNISEAELVSFFGKVAEAATLPVGIQNAPGNLDVFLSAASLKTLNRNHANVSLLKGEGSIDYVRQLMDGTDGVFTLFNGRAGYELPSTMRLGCAGMVPAVDVADVMVKVWNLFRNGDDASVAEAETLHASVLPYLNYVMASGEHMLCYGKRLFAQRVGIEEVHPRHPCILPHAFGEDIVKRYTAALPSLRA